MFFLYAASTDGIASQLCAAVLAAVWAWGWYDDANGGSDATLLVAAVVILLAVLLNLLIAIMSDTYARYSESMTGAWRMQQAMFILAEQSRMNNATYRRKYAITRLWVLDETFDGLDEVSRLSLRDELATLLTSPAWAARALP